MTGPLAVSDRGRADDSLLGTTIGSRVEEAARGFPDNDARCVKPFFLFRISLLTQKVECGMNPV